MTAAVIIVLILVGLPLLACWAGSRRGFWARAEARQVPDPQGDLVRRHRLRPTELAQVQRAVTWGRELSDERLRAAAVDWAQQGRAAEARWRTEHPRLAWFLWWATAVWVAAFLVTAVFAVTRDQWGSVHWLAAVWFLSGPVVGSVVRRNQRRAIALNGGAPAS